MTSLLPLTTVLLTAMMLLLAAVFAVLMTVAF